MPTFPNATALTSSTVTTGTVFPCSESAARNEISSSELAKSQLISFARPGPALTSISLADLGASVVAHNFEASNLVGLADNDPISSYTDPISGTALTGTTTTRPLYKTSVANSLPVARFDDTDDVLVGPTRTALGVDTSGDHAFLAVLRPNNSGAGTAREFIGFHNLSAFSPNNAQSIISQGTTNLMGFGQYNGSTGSAGVDTTARLNANGFVCLIGMQRSGMLYFYVNGTFVGGGTAAASTSINASALFRIGKMYYAGKCDVAVGAVLKTSLTDAQVASLTKYYCTRYGITTPDASTGTTLVVGWDGNVYRLLASGDSTTDPVTDTGTNWQLAHVRNSLTLAVPSRFADLNAAIAFVDSASISASATVTIKVANGQYTYSSTVNFTTPFGRNIQVRGDSTTPANCRITWTNDRGFICSKGGYLDIAGFDFVGPGKAGPLYPDGLAAEGSGATVVANNMVVRNWYHAVNARNGGTIYATSVNASLNGDGGFFAYNGGHLELSNCTANACDPGIGSQGYGLLVEMGASVFVTGGCTFGTTGAGNAAGGIYINKASGTIRSTTCQANIGSGLLLRGGYVEAYNLNLFDNTDRGVTAISGAGGTLSPCNCSNNTNGNYYVAENSALQVTGYNSNVPVGKIGVQIASGGKVFWANLLTSSGSGAAFSSCGLDANGDLTGVNSAGTRLYVNETNYATLI